MDFFFPFIHSVDKQHSEQIYLYIEENSFDIESNLNIEKEEERVIIIDIL